MRSGPSIAAFLAATITLSVSVGANAQILTDEPVAPPRPAQPTPAQPTPPAPPAPPAPPTAPAQPTPPAQPTAPPLSAPPPSQPAAPVFGSSPPAAQAQVATPVAATPAAPVVDGAPDHDRFVGHIGVGYMGIAQLPIGSADGAATINAPVIGVRYWLKRELGIDAGIGFAFASGSTESGGTSADKPSQLGFAVHGGLPINFSYGKHYVFQLVPEGTIGLTSATIKGTPDVSLSGFRLDLGARAGAEIHFGFIGVPELAIQASIGLYLHRESRSATPSGGSSSGESTTTFATSVQGDPWALFANNLSALYYF
jgi:hypothetical protein